MIGQDKYYRLAKEASLEIGKHPGLKEIQNLATKASKILDVGCGEGTRLNLFTGKNKKGVGVDVSSYAIKKAKKQYPHHDYLLTSDANLPFPENTFDLVYSTFVLEHTQNQELYVKEMIRVTKKNGYTVILCPNYGASNRHSPVSIENPTKKLFFGFLRDIFPVNNHRLVFTKVIPKKVFKNPDDDATCEPNLLTLERFVNQLPKIKIEYSSSLWEIDDQTKSLHQRLFKYLGNKKIFPFYKWGPQIFIVIKKI